MTENSLRLNGGKVIIRTVIAITVFWLMRGIASGQNIKFANSDSPSDLERHSEVVTASWDDEQQASENNRPPRSQWTRRTASRNKNTSYASRTSFSGQSSEASDRNQSSRKTDNQPAFRTRQTSYTVAEPAPIYEPRGEIGGAACSAGYGAGYGLPSGSDALAYGAYPPNGPNYPIDRANCPCFAPNTGSIWTRAEYLLWWTKGSHAPPLVTTSPLGTLQADAGVLGVPGAGILFGDEDLNSDMRSGGRFDVGYWLDYDHIFEISGNYFFLGPSASRFEASSDGNPILARPFINVQTNSQASHLIAFPGFASGSINARAVNSIQGLGAMLRVGSFERAEGRFYFLLGYRYLNLNDELLIDETRMLEGPITESLSDRFKTINEFHGGDIGSTVHYHIYQFSLDLLLKVAFGDMGSIVNIEGTTNTTTGGGTTTANNGLLALNSNIGHFSQHNFAMMPEFGATLGFDVTKRLRATVGYTFLYVSKVARAAGQVDTELNLSQNPPGPLVGLAKPEFNLRTEDFWAQGMNFGLEYRF